MTTIAYNANTHKVAFRFNPKASNDDFNAAAEQIGKNAFVEELGKLTIAELVKIYNATEGTDLKKFSSKDAAIERVEKALDEHEVPVFEAGAKPSKPKKPAKQPGNASAAIAKSWTDANVFKARTTRHTVTVNKEDFNSTAAAFQALGLPMGQHIGFRMKLKEAGKLTFEHDGKKYNFTAHLQES